MVVMREYDFIIFGATGFTGQYVAEEVARIADEEHVSWAVAGRNVDKLKAILANVEKATGKLFSNMLFYCVTHLYVDFHNYFIGKSIQDVGIIKADVEDTNSLNDMAKKGRVVLNCVGPYRYQFIQINCMVLF